MDNQIFNKILIQCSKILYTIFKNQTRTNLKLLSNLQFNKTNKIFSKTTHKITINLIKVYLEHQ